MLSVNYKHIPGLKCAETSNSAYTVFTLLARRLTFYYLSTNSNKGPGGSTS